MDPTARVLLGLYPPTTIVTRKRRVGSAQPVQFGVPTDRIVARPRFCGSTVHSRKPGSTKYSTSVSSTARVLVRGSIQRHRFERREVRGLPLRGRAGFPV